VSVPKHLDLGQYVVPATVKAPSGELAALVGTPPAGVAERRAVLAVPGYTGSKEDFIHLLPLIAAAGHPVTAIDLRGQHESGGPEDVEAYTLAALAADVVALADAAPEPVHLIGHSVGGLISRDAVLAGARVRTLTLLASGPGALGGTRGALIELMRPLLADGGVPAVFEASQAIDAADPAKAAQPAEVTEFLRRRFLASPDAALLGLGTAATTAADRVEELRAWGMAVLVAYGELDDAWSPDEQHDMAVRLGAREHRFPDLGHSPAVDDPESVAAVLEDFWSVHP